MKIDDDHAVAGSCHHRGDIPAATAQDEDTFCPFQKRLHRGHIGKPTFSSRRTLTLKDLSFEVETIAGLFAFPDRDVTQFAFVATNDFQCLVPRSMMYLTSLFVASICITK